MNLKTGWGYFFLIPLGGGGSFLSWCRVFFCLDVFVNVGEFGNLLYMCVVREGGFTCRDILFQNGGGAGLNFFTKNCFKMIIGIIGIAEKSA